VTTEKQALALLKEKEFDMVLMVPNLEETDIFTLDNKIKLSLLFYGLPEKIIVRESIIFLSGPGIQTCFLPW